MRHEKAENGEIRVYKNTGVLMGVVTVDGETEAAEKKYKGVLRAYCVRNGLIEVSKRGDVYSYVLPLKVGAIRAGERVYVSWYENLTVGRKDRIYGVKKNGSREILVNVGVVRWPKGVRYPAPVLEAVTFADAPEGIERHMKYVIEKKKGKRKPGRPAKEPAKDRD